LGDSNFVPPAAKVELRLPAAKEERPAPAAEEKVLVPEAGEQGRTRGEAPDVSGAGSAEHATLPGDEGQVRHLADSPEDAEDDFTDLWEDLPGSPATAAPPSPPPTPPTKEPPGAFVPLPPLERPRAPEPPPPAAPKPPVNRTGRWTGAALGLAASVALTAVHLWHGLPELNVSGLDTLPLPLSLLAALVVPVPLGYLLGWSVETCEHIYEGAAKMAILGLVVCTPLALAFVLYLPHNVPSNEELMWTIAFAAAGTVAGSAALGAIGVVLVVARKIAERFA
jgi:hypothetical protein